jgi:predicted SAM-dependent methyltransferase
MRFTKANYFRWSLLLIMIACVAYLAASDLRKIAGDSYRRRIRDPRVIHDYFESHSVRKLQLGAGGNHPMGWLNTDIAPTPEEVYLNATKRYPFPDGSFQYVFSEHMIQAVPWEDGLAMLKECYRVLASGGKLRVVTPNLAKFVQLLIGNPDADAQRFIAAKVRLHGWPQSAATGVYTFNRQFRDWGTQFLYDPATLRKSLELAGFKQITEYRVGEKTDPVFREAEIRTRNEGSDLWVVNRWESMAFEAVR